MAGALQRDQLNRLCSTSETFDKSQSILRLANAKTRPGSGFNVKNPIAIPAVCAYLASEQLNTGEVSLQSAMSAACVSKSEFNYILKTIRAALGPEQEHTIGDLTYEALVDAYRVQSKTYAIACMEDAEAALPRVCELKVRYGAHAVLCAIFHWVCQLLEESSVQERHLRQTYAIHPRTFKAVVSVLDKQCDVIADQIKAHSKSPKKYTTRQAAVTSEPPVLVTTPSKKRIDDRVSFVDTPTKKRRVDFATPTKPKTSVSPTKRPLADSTTAFRAALQGSPTKLPVTQETQSPGAGPSTPRRPRLAKAVGATADLIQDDSGPSPTRSQKQDASPTRSAVQRRFRPVFLEQQQWCAQDPKVERLWATAVTLQTKMAGLHGHPFWAR